MMVQFIYRDIDGSLGVQKDTKSPEVPFVRGLPAKMMVYILTQMEQGRYNFSIREFRLHPDFEVEPGTHNISSRIHVLRQRIQDLGLPLEVVRGKRGEFSVLLNPRASFSLQTL